MMRAMGLGRLAGEGRRVDGRRLRATVLVLALVTASGAFTAGCGSSSAKHDAEATARIRAAQARAVARQAGLDPSVQDFLARAAAASSVTSTVVYDDGQGRNTVVMSAAPDRRIDISGAGSAASAARLVVRGTQTYVCHLAGPKWTCVGGVVSAPSGPFTPDAVTRTIASLAPLGQTYQFSVTHRSMVGLVADCLAADRRSDQPIDPAVGSHAAICIAPSGVILRVEGIGKPLQATSYRDSVPSGAFKLPGPVVPAPAPSPSTSPTT